MASLIPAIDRLMPYAVDSSNRKASLAIWQNQEKHMASISFWYDKDDSGMEAAINSEYNLDKHFSFKDSGWISFESSEIQNFTPEWVDANNAEQTIMSTFLGSCSYAKAINSSCSIHGGNLSCFFTFKIG